MQVKNIHSDDYSLSLKPDKQLTRDIILEVNASMMTRSDSMMSCKPWHIINICCINTALRLCMNKYNSIFTCGLTWLLELDALLVPEFCATVAWPVWPAWAPSPPDGR